MYINGRIHHHGQTPALADRSPNHFIAVRLVMPHFIRQVQGHDFAPWVKQVDAGVGELVRLEFTFADLFKGLDR